MFSFFKLGLLHVLDIYGFDHMLFITMMLCGVDLKNWKGILGIITAFTLGHSITLAYATLNAPLIPSEIVEFLIPVTIFLTSLINLNRPSSNSNYSSLYVITSSFGFIHGLGFAGFLKNMLPTTDNVWPMFIGFNFGIEVAQLILAAIVISVIYLFHFTSKQTIQIAQRGLSIVGGLISLLLAIQNFPL